MKHHGISNTFESFTKPCPEPGKAHMMLYFHGYKGHCFAREFRDALIEDGYQVKLFPEKNSQNDRQYFLLQIKDIPEDMAIEIRKRIKENTQSLRHICLMGRIKCHVPEI